MCEQPIRPLFQAKCFKCGKPVLSPNPQRNPALLEKHCHKKIIALEKKINEIVEFILTREWKIAQCELATAGRMAATIEKLCQLMVEYNIVSQRNDDQG